MNRAKLYITFFSYISFLTLSLFCVVFLYKNFILRLPDIKQIQFEGEVSNLTKATVTLDKNNQTIAAFGSKNREYMQIYNIPDIVKKSFVAAEDQNFYEHSGIDYGAIFRAILVNLKHFKIKQGASTMTQQVARLLYLQQDRTIERKIKEAMLATIIENRLSKAEILEIYLNKIFLGNNSWGVQSAAKSYFGKDINEVNISEAALLASLPKAPTFYAPHRHYERALERKNWVLNRMFKLGFINQEVYKVELAHRPVINNKNNEKTSPALKNFILKELTRSYITKNDISKGYIIKVSINLKTQNLAINTLKLFLSPRDDLQAALISFHSKSGFIEKYIVSKDYETSHFDRLLNMQRDIGAFHRFFSYLYFNQRGYPLLEVYDDMQQTKPLVFKNNEISEYINKKYKYNFLQTNTSGRIISSPLKLAYLFNDSLNLKKTRSIPRLIQEINNSSLNIWGSSDMFYTFDPDKNHIIATNFWKNMIADQKHCPSIPRNDGRTFIYYSTDHLLHNVWLFYKSNDKSNLLWIGSEFGKKKIKKTKGETQKLVCQIARKLINQDQTLMSKKLGQQDKQQL